MTPENHDLFVWHPTPTLVIDAATLRIMKANRAATDYFSIPRETLMQRNLHDLVREEDFPSIPDPALSAQPSASQSRLIEIQAPECRGRTVNAVWLATHLDDQPVLVLALENARSAECDQGNPAPGDLERHLRDALESIHDPLFVVAGDGSIEFMNQAATQLCIEGRAIGSSLWSQLRGECADALRSACEHSSLSRSARTTDEFVLDDRTLEVNAYPTENGLLVYLRDISEHRAMQERLRQAHKMQAVGQLTGGIAHDFNNLLTVIIGNSDLLSEQLETQVQLKALADITGVAAQRGAELTHRLLAFSRRQPLQPTRVDLNRLIAGMDGLLRGTLEENVEIELVRGGGLWVAEVDPGQLEVALLNLAINARDAMPGGGRLTIETANVSFDDNYAGLHDEVIAGQYVLVSISDTGCGIAGAALPHVFEPFFTTKESGQGSGLGLSMVYGFAKQSGGHINIYSERDEGTTVKLYLPRSQGDINVASASERQLESPGGSEHILVVEDDELVREHLCRQLEGLGYRVTTADHGAGALRLVQQQPDIDLLFTDVVMPGGMNGRELAEAVRAVRPDLKVLYTSGYTENAIVHQGRLDPGVELLSKPYRRRELAAKLRKVLDA